MVDVGGYIRQVRRGCHKAQHRSDRNDGRLCARLAERIGQEFVRYEKYSDPAIGTKQTWACAPHMSAIGGKADMTYCGAHVCL